MIVVEETIVIGAPAEDVFGFVTDFRHSPEWQDTALDIRKVTDGPVRVGSRFEGIRKVMGRNMEVAVEFVEYEPPHSARWTLAGGSMPGQASYHLESTPAGTKVTNTIELHPRGIVRLASPLIAAAIRRDVKSAQPRLKELLESKARSKSRPDQDQGGDQ